MDNQVTNTTTNVEDIVKLINRTNESFCYSVWVPSLSRDIMFREITTSQQKRIIKAVIDSPVYNTEFIFALRQILKENCADKEVDTDSLTIIDKMFILIAMRIASIGDVLNYQFEHKDKTYKKDIDLAAVLNNAKTSINTITNTTITDDKYYTLECSIPSIGTEYRLESELRKGMAQDNDSLNDSEKLRKIIGDTFTSEICKFINSITIKEVNGETASLKKIDLNGLSFRNRITIIEQLPAKLLKDVIKYIESIKAEMNKVVLLKFNIEVGSETEAIEERLAIDSNFFTAS